MYEGIRTSIAKKPYFCDFSGESGPPVPPFDPRMGSMVGKVMTPVSNKMVKHCLYGDIFRHLPVFR